MIFTYNFSVIGTSHIKKSLPCQDYSIVVRRSDGWIIAASADGVGSAKHADIGAKLAVETAVDLCDRCLGTYYDEVTVKRLIYIAYVAAYQKIVAQAAQDNGKNEDYDTTLDLVIYNGAKIVYGHSGDGGIIALTAYGDYIKVTEPQKGEDKRSVIPLRAGPAKWEIESFDERVSSVLLVTDGIWEVLFPYELNCLSQSTGIYVPLAMFLMDPAWYEKDPGYQNIVKKLLENDITAQMVTERLKYAVHIRVWDQSETSALVEDTCKNNQIVNFIQEISDDKTVVAVINSDIQPQSKEAQFYAEPDWKEAHEAYRRIAYPHLYPEKPDTDPTGNREEEKPVVLPEQPASGKPSQPPPAPFPTNEQPENEAGNHIATPPSITPYQAPIGIKPPNWQQESLKKTRRTKKLFLIIIAGITTFALLFGVVSIVKKLIKPKETHIQTTSTQTTAATTSAPDVTGTTVTTTVETIQRTSTEISETMPNTQATDANADNATSNTMP